MMKQTRLVSLNKIGSMDGSNSITKLTDRTHGKHPNRINSLQIVRGFIVLIYSFKAHYLSILDVIQINRLSQSILLKFNVTIINHTLLLVDDSIESLPYCES
jgi:hypothetical protein